MSIDEELARVGAILVEDRVLRRLIKQHRRLGGIGLQVPHAECYTLARTALEKLVESRELAIEFVALPAQVIAFGGDRQAIAAHEPAAMTRAWRAIFHGHIHQAFEDLLLHGKLTAAAIRERINRIGQTEFDEVRYVLRQEDLLLPPADDTAMYIEFVALYLELLHFDPGSLERTFSTLHDAVHVMSAIRQDIDATTLLAASRPPGAPESPLVTALAEPVRTPRLEAATDRSALRAATVARRKGNDARAAILAFRGGDLDSAHLDLDKLVARLVRALGGGSSDGWVEGLFPLVRSAASQPTLRFTADARLFHDLQSACVIAERDVKVVDVVSWALSLGKRPIIRSLPATREVRIAKRLHSAVVKIAACDLATREERERLSDVLHAMTARAEEGVRTVLRPAIERALDEVELHPQNLPEQVAEKKIVDELLDQAVTVGRLTLGNLRDAISQNELKIPDLHARELLSDDQLLRCDHALSISLDGVYRRGEIYLRFLQKMSSVLFGTAIGRFLCLYLLLPVLGSFVTLEGLQHMVGPLSKWLFHVHPEIATWPAFIGLAVFLFLLIHVPFVRRGTVIVVSAIGTALRAVLIRAPFAFLKIPLVRVALESWLARWIVRPAIPALITWGLIPSWWRWPIAACVFVLVQLTLNSRIGRMGQELILDGLVRSGRQVVRRIIPGIVRFILELFGRLIELSDRAIYRVDEWLRFRVGQSVVVIFAKGLLGLVWFVLTYLLRIYLNVFIEPVVNPVKHFPVVTVTGKIMVPFYAGIVRGITNSLTPLLGRALAGSIAGFTILVVPGFAGFLVWELKANWRLYVANRSSVLRPSAFGHHGETVVGLMKPGFHSGTIPKAFARLRRATWKSDERNIAKQEEGLHHVEEAIQKFTNRELVSLLNEGKPFRARDVAVERVELASNRIVLALLCPSVGDTAATIAIEQQSGFIVAGITEQGWLANLDAAQRRIFEIALAGFYKLAAIDIVREQLVAVLGPVPYDISDEGLVVWPGEGYQTELLYDLRSHNLAPIVRGPTAGVASPSFINRHALYFREPLRWPTWATAWEQLVAGKPPERIIGGPELLPSSTKHAA